MQLLVIDQNTPPVSRSRLYSLLEKNYTPDKHQYSPYYQYKYIQSQEYWFGLMNSEQQIIADCAVKRVYYPCSWIVRYYLIENMHVSKEFRGNNYATLLILNLMLHLHNKYGKRISFRIYTHQDN